MPPDTAAPPDLATPPQDPTAEFESHRRHLRGLAYRMLGSRAQAEDIVQEAWLRWRDCDHARIDVPRAFLTRVVTHLCLDHLKSAQQRREEYVGVWLPEPLVEDRGLYAAGPESAAELASDLSFAFLLALERLTPLERAAFLLHEVFEVGMDEVATALGRSNAACRQLVSRARDHIRRDKMRAQPSAESRSRLAMAFAVAIRDGDMAGLVQVLAQDAVFLSDGGGRVTAVPRPLHGAERIAKALLGFARLYDLAKVKVVPAQINGLDGAVLYDLQGQPIQTLALEVGSEGRISAIYVVRNPDKLAHLVGPPSAAS